LRDGVDKDTIDDILKQAIRLPKSLKSFLDDTEKLYTETSVVPTRVPKPKRRKTDIRTLRKRKRASAAKSAKERADERREADGSLRHQFFKLRREMNRRARKDVRPNSVACWDWNLKLEEWINLWLSCPLVDLGNGVKVSANSLRGRRAKENVQLRRIDPTKPFEINNLVIMRGKKVLYVPKKIEES
jgi:hypothetical protein